MSEQEPVTVYRWITTEKDSFKIGLAETGNNYTCFALVTGEYVGADELPIDKWGESIENSVTWLRGIVNNPYQAERAAFQLIKNWISMLRPDDDTPWHHEHFAYFLFDLLAINWPIGEYAKTQGKELPARK